jgi:hypothetical protein
MRTVVLLVIIATGCKPQPNEQQRDAVSAVIDADTTHVKALREKLTQTKDRAVMVAAINDYLDRANRLNLSACPEEFAATYRAYQLRWREFLKAVSAGIDTAEQTADIDKHWKEVLAMARKYGAGK